MDNRSLTILCIDDDEQINYALNAVFDFQGWQSLLAGNVRSGVQLFEKHRPNLVLIDYHMPEINGIEGVKMLRAIDATVPIIVFTIDENQAVADRFLEAGASDFALKPIKAPDIISRIKLHIQLLNTRRPQEESFKGIGSSTLALIIDFMRHNREFLTASDIARRTGLAYQTTYRYLQYLIAEQKVETKNVYGKIGRPKQLFRLL